MAQDWNNTDRGVSYALQMQTPSTELLTFVRGEDTHIHLPLDKAGFAKGRMEFTPKYALSKFTRTQVYNGLAQVARRAAAHFGGASALPTKAGKDAAIHILTSKHEVQSGKNKGRKVILAMHALGVARRADKAATANAALAAAQAEGTAYIAEGVKLKDGGMRVFVSRDKAAKAWVRANHPLKGDWWTDKANKASWVAKGETKTSLAPKE